VKSVAKAAGDKLAQIVQAGVAPARPAPLQRFPVQASNAVLFPAVLPRPNLLAPVALEGMAVDKSGQPLSDVTVSVRGAGSPARADAAGRFVLSGVDVNLPLFLRLSKDGYVTTNTSYLNPHSSRENLRFVLVTPAELSQLMGDFGTMRGAPAVVLIASQAPGLTFQSSPPVTGKPGVGTTRFKALDPSTGFSAVGITQINFTAAYPSQPNDHEPNVIITANPLGRDVVMPVFVGQVTYAMFIPF
jgi:hypothetical protein